MMLYGIFVHPEQVRADCLIGAQFYLETRSFGFTNIPAQILGHSHQVPGLEFRDCCLGIGYRRRLELQIRAKRANGDPQAG